MRRLVFSLCLWGVLHAQSFEGIVYDARSGAPLSSVRVQATSNGQSVTTVTDSAGHFRLAVANENGLPGTPTLGGSCNCPRAHAGEYV